VGIVTHPYERIAADLRAAILDGHLAPGAVVPSENQLAARYTVNRTTVRHALELLRADGLIDTRQGARARVRAAPVVRIMNDGGDWRRHRTAKRPGFDATVAEHGLTPRQEILDAQDPAVAPVQVAVNLDLDDTSPVVMRYVRQYADEIPVRLVRLWFPAAWASGTALAGGKRIRGGVAAYVEELTGRRIATSDIELEGRNPTPLEKSEKDGLDLARGVSVVRVLTTFLDAEGKPVYVQEEVADASKHRWHFRVVL
jgi:GntR family transcriptional regulator